MNHGKSLRPRRRAFVWLAAALALLLLWNAFAHWYESRSFLKFAARPATTLWAESAPAALEELFDRATAHAGFAGAVTLMRDGRPVYERAFGASRPGGPPVTLDTAFAVGSLTKPFTAALAARLAAAGRIDLARSPCAYLPDCPGPLRDITLAQMLAHASGLERDATAPWENALNALAGGRLFRLTEAELLARAARADREALPDGQILYSNLAYMVLSLALEKASGRPLGELFAAELLRPAGMKDSFLLEERASLPVSAAHGMWVARRWGEPALRHEAVPEMERIGEGRGAGALVTTPRDLARWLNAQDRGEILGRPFAETVSGRAEPYVLGWAVDKAGDGSALIWHNGKVTGFSSLIARVPAHGVSLIFVSNTPAESADLKRVYGALNAIVRGEPYEVPDGV